MTYDRHNIRKWLLLGGSTCPLTGVKLITRKVRYPAPAGIAFSLFQYCVVTAQDMLHWLVCPEPGLAGPYTTIYTVPLPSQPANVLKYCL